MRARSLKVSQQLTLAESLKSRSVYSKDSERYKLVSKKLAIFIGSTNVANSIVENLEFKDLLHTMDSRYVVPGRVAIGKELDKVLIELKAKIGSFLQEANKISICSDIWTKKGMSSSYLGITGHFFTRKDHRRHSVTLAVRRMPSPHSGNNIRELVDEVLREWDIPPSKISATLTDNGSNMIAAFRPQLSDDDNNDEVIMSEEDADLSQGSSLIEEFEERELDHELAFHELKRVSCFAHTLQLVVHKFDEVTTFKVLLKHAHNLIKKVNTSFKATERLIARSGKKLLRDCPTRWSSTYLMIDSLLEVRSSLTQVLQELEWDNLATSEWKTLEALKNLLYPFAQFTSLISGEEFTTISSVIPAIMDLNLHLEEMNQHAEVGITSKKLQAELKRRFRKYTDPSDANYEHLFLLATSLDPRYRLLLNAVQTSVAKSQLLQEIKEPGDNGSSSEHSPSHEIGYEVTSEEPPTKRFRHLDKVLEQKWKEGMKRKSTLPPGQAEVERYFDSVETLAENVDPLAYWANQTQDYPLLSSIALDVLAIPASSAPIERVFSTAGESTTGKRNRLTDSNLEREVLLKKNKHFL